MKKLIVLFFGMLFLFGCEGFSISFNTDIVSANFGTLSASANDVKTELDTRVSALFVTLETEVEDKNLFNTNFAKYSTLNDVASFEIESYNYGLIALSALANGVENLGDATNIVISEHTNGNCTLTYTYQSETEVLATFETTETSAKIIYEVDDEFIFSRELIQVDAIIYAWQIVYANVDSTFTVVQLYVNGNDVRFSVLGNSATEPTTIIGLTTIPTSFATIGDYVCEITETTFNVLG